MTPQQFILPKAEVIRRYIEEVEPVSDKVVALWDGFKNESAELDPDFMEWVLAGGFAE
jgi:hypothetical protein